LYFAPLFTLFSIRYPLKREKEREREREREREKEWIQYGTDSDIDGTFE
jgi:hypothetical protein